MADVLQRPARRPPPRPQSAQPIEHPAPERAPRSGNVRGALFLCFGIFIFMFQDVIIRWMSGSYPIHQVVLIRSVVALPLVTAIVWYEVGLRALATRRIGLHVARGFSSFTTYMTYYLALAALPFAENVAITFSSPLVITVLSVIFLGERVGLLRAAAVLTGFAGVLLIARPGTSVFDPAALIAVVSACTYGISALIARPLGRTDSAAVMSFYTTLIYLGMSTGLSLVLHGGVEGGEGAHKSLAFMSRPWMWPGPLDLALICATGVIAAVGFDCLNEAYRSGEPSAVAPFEYTSLLWATAVGFLLFGEVPGLITIGGTALIVLAGLVILFSEMRRKTEAAQAGRPANRPPQRRRAS
jgi:drug/metabolite transporter (DMT)-like permease